METVIIILLVIVVIAHMVHYFTYRSKLAIVVTASFIFILLSHVPFLTSGWESNQCVVGKIIQLGAFLVLLFILLSMRGPDE